MVLIRGNLAPIAQQGAGAREQFLRFLEEDGQQLDIEIVANRRQRVPIGASISGTGNAAPTGAGISETKRLGCTIGRGSGLCAAIGAVSCPGSGAGPATAVGFGCRLWREDRCSNRNAGIAGGSNSNAGCAGIAGSATVGISSASAACAASVSLSAVTPPLVSCNAASRALAFSARCSAG
jgi:hypothetical protein